MVMNVDSMQTGEQTLPASLVCEHKLFCTSLFISIPFNSDTLKIYVFTNSHSLPNLLL